MSAPAPSKNQENSITVYFHSQLFYWWPVWVVGYLLAILSWVDGYRMAIVPAGSEVLRDPVVMVTTRDTSNQTTTDTLKNRDVIVLPEGLRMPSEDEANAGSKPEELRLHIAGKPGYGVVFTFVLVLVIVITNVPLRGMWSVVMIVTLLLTSIIFHLAGWWGPILKAISLLDIRINAGGYIFISTALLVLWVITVFFFDRMMYMVFTPGQFKVCTAIGEGEKVYDTVGISLEKHRDDFFRHMILGLGSGDLVVKTSGAQQHQWDLHNVLFIGHKVSKIEEMLKVRLTEPG